MRVRSQATISGLRSRRSPADVRLTVFTAAVFLGMAILTVRLFDLQVLSHGFYAALASDQHGIFAELFPERGTVYLSDPEAPLQRFPAAVNKNLSLVYAEPRQIEDPAEVAQTLAPLLEMEEEPLRAKLARRDDPYEPLKRRVPEELAERIKSLALPGIGFAKEQYRHYPERWAASHLIGFVGSDEEGQKIGRYGVEGYWETELAGQRGFLETDSDPVGRWIGGAERRFRPARDGDDIVLTVDRNIQYVACERLRQAVELHGAAGGAVVVLDPESGAVLAMCGAPDFDPNDFSQVDDISVFNNPATYLAYEPGSVMKPITMAAALDAEKVLPYSTYEDKGEVKFGPFTIRNADGKAHGLQTMTQVLEKSLNTGAVYAVGRLGADRFRDYVTRFGFGAKAGLELESESAGNTSSLSKRGEIWSATASYGQGITVTPLQLAAAYAALANGGKLMKPYLVAEINRVDGSVKKTEPTVVRQVISKRASTLISGMLVRVVERGHGQRAGVPGYYIAGKTGTAQIANPYGQGYLEHAFNGTFVGYGPVDDPAFVMAVKIDRPQGVQYAEATAAPLFGEIASFLLQYMKIPPSRPR